MSKLLFWIVVILIALIAVRLATRHAAAKARPPAEPASRRRKTRSEAAQTMVQCAHCGIHLPTSEAVRRQGHNYCGLPHSLKGPAP